MMSDEGMMLNWYKMALIIMKSINTWFLYRLLKWSWILNIQFTAHLIHQSEIIFFGFWTCHVRLRFYRTWRGFACVFLVVIILFSRFLAIIFIFRVQVMLIKFLQESKKVWWRSQLLFPKSKALASTFCTSYWPNIST